MNLKIYLFIWNTFSDYLLILIILVARGTFLKIEFVSSIEIAHYILTCQCQKKKEFDTKISLALFATLGLDFNFLYQIYLTSDQTFTLDVNLSSLDSNPKATISFIRN